MSSQGSLPLFVAPWGDDGGPRPYNFTGLQLSVRHGGIWWELTTPLPSSSFSSISPYLHELSQFIMFESC